MASNMGTSSEIWFQDKSSWGIDENSITNMSVLRDHGNNNSRGSWYMANFFLRRAYKHEQSARWCLKKENKEKKDILEMS